MSDHIWTSIYRAYLRLTQTIREWLAFLAQHPVMAAAYTLAWFWTGAVVWSWL